MFLYLQNLAVFEKYTMFTGHTTMIILGKMRKCTDEILETSRYCNRDNKKIEVSTNEGKREKLVLRFSRCPILDCAAKEEDLMKRRCEWKVSTPSNSQTKTVKENVEENKSVAVNRLGSADDEK